MMLISGGGGKGGGQLTGTAGTGAAGTSSGPGVAGSGPAGTIGSEGSAGTTGGGNESGTAGTGGSSATGTAGTTGGGGTGGTMGAAGITGSGGTNGVAGTSGKAGTTGSAGTTGAAGSGPINVLIWNNAVAYGHQARVGAITYLKARESTDNIKFDTTYAHTGNVTEGASDTNFDASVFTDAGLDKYDVVFFLDTTGTTIDDSQKATRRQALQDFIEKKGRGFVGTHSATDTYQGGAWPWYVDFIGSNFKDHSAAGTSGTARFASTLTDGHPILTAGSTPNPWNRKEEWYTFTSDPLASKIAGIKILLTCHDTSKTEERPSAWVHEMPMMAGAPRGGRMFYTAFGHFTSAFMEKEVMDMVIAGIKWAAYRL